jgi:hypothetical protein
VNRVTCIAPSPIHDHQWLLTFACGHRTSVTSKTKPVAGRYTCGDCWWAEREAREAAAAEVARP